MYESCFSMSNYNEFGTSPSTEHNISNGNYLEDAQHQKRIWLYEDVDTQHSIANKVFPCISKWLFVSPVWANLNLHIFQQRDLTVWETARDTRLRRWTPSGSDPQKFGYSGTAFTHNRTQISATVKPPLHVKSCCQRTMMRHLTSSPGVPSLAVLLPVSIVEHRRVMEPSRRSLNTFIIRARTK